MDVPCASCGAKIGLERDEAFFSCPFCQSTLYLDRAHTFKRFVIPPVVPPARVEDLLAQEFARSELPLLPVVSAEPLLLPFWAVRGAGIQETHPAFSPCPSALSDYRLPSAGAVWFRPEEAEGFRQIDCAGLSSASWEGREEVSSFALYSVPFHRIAYGVKGSLYTAWMEGVSGRIYLDQAPPPLTDAITRRFWQVMGGALLLFALEGCLIPGWPAFLAAALTAAAAYPFLKSRLEGRGA